MEKIHREFSWFIRIAFMASLFLLLIGWLFFELLIPKANLSPRESALQETQQLLAFIENHPTGSMPDTLPGYLRVNDVCWIFLQKCMTSNENQYKLSVISEFDSQTDPNFVHNLIEVWVSIDFPNGQQAEMLYSQGGLTGCQEK